MGDSRVDVEGVQFDVTSDLTIRDGGTFTAQGGSKVTAQSVIIESGGRAGGDGVFDAPLFTNHGRTCRALHPEY